MVGQVLESHKITFHEDELPSEGLRHNKALYIIMQFGDKFIARVLIDGGSSLNICPLTTLKRLGKGLHEIQMGSMNVKAFDGSQRDTNGEINLDQQMGPTWFGIEFQVLDISATYNLLLGRPWIHTAGAVASILHQIVMFEWNHQEVIIHGDGSNLLYTNQTVPVIENRRKLGGETYHSIVWVNAIEKDRCVIITYLDEPTVVTCKETMQNKESDSEYLEVPKEIVKEVENFEKKPKSNLEETEAVNLGDFETVKETCISINLSPPEKENKTIAKEIQARYEAEQKGGGYQANQSQGYYQIWMDEEDAGKIAFITPYGIYSYKMMPFSLKKVGSTYMRSMMTLFHDMIHKEIEVYMDGVIIKSKRSPDHIADLRKFFDRLQK
ncbi:uncharacterized protein [Nicotiana tomentosiformis]|uniref:uncharacterized protein n=1 Tax=Nicotiana tomentosiformis TaxID=4098 RepID=UPI00388C88E8